MRVEAVLRRAGRVELGQRERRRQLRRDDQVECDTGLDQLIAETLTKRVSGDRTKEADVGAEAPEPAGGVERPAARVDAEIARRRRDQVDQRLSGDDDHGLKSRGAGA